MKPLEAFIAVYGRRNILGQRGKAGLVTSGGEEKLVQARSDAAGKRLHRQ